LLYKKEKKGRGKKSTGEYLEMEEIFGKGVKNS
jgi:hypothetical protein